MILYFELKMRNVSTERVDDGVSSVEGINGFFSLVSEHLSDVDISGSSFHFCV